MRNVVCDFVESSRSTNGVGVFHGNKIAIQESKRISKNQRRKFLKYKQIPRPFLFYLQKIGIIPRDKNIKTLTKDATPIDVVEMLNNFSSPDTVTQDMAELIFKSILICFYDVPETMFSKGGRYCKIIEERSIYRLSRRNPSK